MAKYLFVTGSVGSFTDKGISTPSFWQALKRQGTVTTRINWAFIRMYILM